MKIVREWVQEKRKEFQLSTSTDSKVEFLIKKERQENSKKFKKFKQFLEEVGQDFHLKYVDNLASYGVPWGDNLLDDIATTEADKANKDVFIKMQTLPLRKQERFSLKKVLERQVNRSLEETKQKVETSSHPSLPTLLTS